MSQYPVIACGGLYLAIMALFMLSSTIVIHVFEHKMIKENAINSNILNEVAADWLQQPIVDAIVYTPPLYTPPVTVLTNTINQRDNKWNNAIDFWGSSSYNDGWGGS